jgi:hypothetical protein
MDISVGTFRGGCGSSDSRGRWRRRAQGLVEPAPRRWAVTRRSHRRRTPSRRSRWCREGSSTPTHVRWERRFQGKLIFGKDAEAQRLLAKRIRDLRVDVLAVQEVEEPSDAP